MQLETIVKLVNANKNCFGYVKADVILKEIQENLRCYELIVTVRRTTEKDINIDSILNQIILPICKAKQVLARVTNQEVHIFTRKITKLHILNQIFYHLNTSLGKDEGFEVMSNYDLVREQIRSKEIN